jgi:hypothetical protein
MTLHIETGHPVTGDAVKIDARAVRFVTDDGRTMFEVLIGDDGKSLKVYAIEMTKHDGQIYENMLHVCPIAVNALTIGAVPYQD